MNLLHKFCLMVLFTSMFTLSAWGQMLADDSALPKEGLSAISNLVQEQDQHMVGSLAIQAVQGTPDSPAIGVTDVEVDLLHQNAVFKTIKAQLDEYGIIVLDDIPLNISVQPVIRVAHAGVTYQEVGAIMDSTHPQQTVKVTCYEVTNDIPAWSIPIRQVMLSFDPMGIKVTEIVMIMNPDKQTWLGTHNPPNKPVTMSVSLPPSAEHISLGTGFHDWCCTSFDNNILVNHLPLMPHMTELNYSYIVPITDGSFDLDIIAQAGIEQVVVMLPEEMHTHSVEGLALRGTRQIADTQVRYYSAMNLKKGDMVGLAISELAIVNAVLPRTGQSDIDSMQMIVIVGVVVFLLAAIYMILSFKARTSVRGVQRGKGEE